MIPCLKISSILQRETRKCWVFNIVSSQRFIFINVHVLIQALQAAFNLPASAGDAEARERWQDAHLNSDQRDFNMVDLKFKEEVNQVNNNINKVHIKSIIMSFIFFLAAEKDDHSVFMGFLSCDVMLSGLHATWSPSLLPRKQPTADGAVRSQGIYC